MQRRGKYSKDSASALEDPMINLTPLIDVVFVVLIIFILIAPLLELDKVQLASGPGSTTTRSLNDKSPISIYVHADNSIWFHDRRITPAALRVELEVAREQFPTATPHIFHDKSAHFGTYQAVKGAVEGAGFREMDIILSPS